MSDASSSVLSTDQVLGEQPSPHPDKAGTVDGRSPLADLERAVNEYLLLDDLAEWVRARFVRKPQSVDPARAIG